MLEVEKEMFIQSLLKNSNYVVSKRNFLSDYSRIESKKIDMTLSGKFLSSYGKLKINSKEFDKYPSHDEINKLEQEIKNHENIQQEIILGAGANGILQNIIKLFLLKEEIWLHHFIHLIKLSLELHLLMVKHIEFLLIIIKLILIK